jgi:hypothetical protein
VDNFPHNESIIVSDSRERNLPRKSSEASTRFIPRTTGTFGDNMLLISDSDLSTKRLHESSRNQEYNKDRINERSRDKSIQILSERSYPKGAEQYNEDAQSFNPRDNDDANIDEEGHEEDEQQYYEKSITKKSEKSYSDAKYKTLEEQIVDMQHHLDKLHSNKETIVGGSKRNTQEKFNIKSFSEFEDDKDIINDRSNFVSMIPSPINANANTFDFNNYVNTSNINNNTQNNKSNITAIPNNKQTRPENNNLGEYLVDNVSPGSNNVTSEKINNIENKVTLLENEIHGLKSHIGKLNQNLENIVEMKNSINSNNMNFVLDECRKMINSNVNNNNNNYNASTYYNTRMAPMSTVKHDGVNRREQLERRITRAIDDKFENLISNLQNKIYNTLLKPGLTRLENTLHNNMEEIKNNLKKLENTNRGNKSSKRREINEVVETLLDKINKKERIIEEMQREATYDNRNNRDANSSLSNISQLN